MLAKCLLSSERAEEIRIFYSYSRHDAAFRERIDEILGRFKWDVDVRTWYDGMNLPGTVWEEELFRNIDSAHIILFFMTESFLASAYCQNVEVPRALARQDRGEVKVIPILVGRGVEIVPPFDRLQCLPRNGVPIEAWENPKEAIRAVVQGIVDLIAGAALGPEGRCRWQVRFRGSRQEVPDELQLKIVRGLRKKAGDASLRPLALDSRCSGLLVESSRAGLDSFKEWFRGARWPRIARLEVLEVLELFGAGFQASSRVVAEETAEAADLLLYPSEPMVPLMIKGIVIEDDRELRLEFLIDGGTEELSEAENLAASRRCIDYFRAALAAPKDDMWVNLSPDETNRMLGASLAGTEMGRGLLEADLRLKRFAASLLHPDCEIGREFWQEVANRLRLAGTAAGDISTFQRIWLVPDKAVLYSDPAEGGHRHSALIVESHLGIRCETGSLQAQWLGAPASLVAADTTCAAVFKELVVPVVEKELSEGSQFATLRQIQNSLILAAWLKRELKDRPGWSTCIDSGVPAAATINDLRPADLKEYFATSSKPKNALAEPRASGKTISQVDEARRRALDAAVLLRETGRVAESLVRLRELVAECRQDGGSMTETTQAAISQLGRTLLQMGQVAQAETLHEEVLRQRRFLLGDEHPHTINSMIILAGTLAAAGKSAAAEELEREAQLRRDRSGAAFSIAENREFYEEYMQVFRRGVFNLTRPEFDFGLGASTRRVRSYCAGAIDCRSLPPFIESLECGLARDQECLKKSTLAVVDLRVGEQMLHLQSGG